MTPPIDEQEWEELASPPEENVLGDYRVELPVFEGPLDLLLHLIRKHEIDIFDIPIALITEKYLAYLDWMRVLNLDIAGDFLVMAATLAQIKSKMLLPPSHTQDEESEEEPSDPRDELVRRLLEYQKYKEAAKKLQEQPVLNRDVFIRGPLESAASEEESPFTEISVFKLIEALDKVLRNASVRINHEIFVERVSIAQRIQELIDLLQDRKEITFEEIFDTAPTKPFVIVTFIALLEMTRLRLIRMHQPEGSAHIYIRGFLENTGDIQELQEVDLE